VRVIDAQVERDFPRCRSIAFAAARLRLVKAGKVVEIK
jgi:hypothetical protein